MCIRDRYSTWEDSSRATPFSKYYNEWAREYISPSTPVTANTNPFDYTAGGAPIVDGDLLPPLYRTVLADKYKNIMFRDPDITNYTETMKHLFPMYAQIKLSNLNMGQTAFAPQSEPPIVAPNDQSITAIGELKGLIAEAGGGFYEALCRKFMDTTNQSSYYPAVNMAAAFGFGPQVIGSDQSITGYNYELLDPDIVQTSTDPTKQRVGYYIVEQGTATLETKKTIDLKEFKS